MSKKPFQTALCALTLALLCSLPGTAQEANSTFPQLGATSLLIDLETFPGPDGELGTADDVPAPICGGLCFPLGSEYNALGFNFTGGWLFQAEFFPDEGPDNHFVSSTPMEVTFLRDVYSVSVQSYSSWSATLWALDSMSNVITSDELVHPNEGSGPEFGTLTVHSDTPITRVVLRASVCGVAGACDFIINADNLRLQFTPSVLFQDGFETGNTLNWSDTTP